MIRRWSTDKSTSVTLVVAPMFSYLALAICIDAFRVANRLTTALTFDWTVAAETSKEVISSSGPGIVPHTTLKAISFSPVTILLTAYDPEAACTPGLMAWLREQDRLGGRIGCVDTAALVLARAGVLRGHPVAVHQEVVAPFREEIGELVLDKRYTFDDALFSSAGGFATMDMVLKLISHIHGNDLAKRVAGATNFEQSFSDRMQENDHYLTGLARVERRLGRLVGLMQGNLETPLPISRIAALAQVEESTARRLFHRYLRQSPQRYYLRLRLERAQNLLRYSHLRMSQIAAATGFTDSASFSRSYSREFGIPPSRARLNPPGAP